jgi:hypothetical protein
MECLELSFLLIEFLLLFRSFLKTWIFFQKIKSLSNSLYSSYYISYKYVANNEL